MHKALRKSSNDTHGASLRWRSSNGFVFQTSKSSKSIVLGRHWYVAKIKKYRYAVCYSQQQGKTIATYLHRLLCPTERGEMVDHINGDTLDNRLCNLRPVTNKQNQYNQHAVRGKIPYQGVTYENGKYRARIRKDGAKRNIGTFNTAEAAADAYKHEAKQRMAELIHKRNQR